MSSAVSGAHGSSYSARASRPMRWWAPARWPMRPSPVQSRKRELSKRIRRSDPIIHPVTEVIRRASSGPSASTSRTSVLR